MIERRAILGVVVGALALAATLRADMMPASAPAVPSLQPPPICLAGAEHDPGPSDVLGSAAIADHVQALLARCTLDSGGMVEPAGEIQPLQILSDRQSSFSLCLYALVGLGLFRSAPLVKKLSFGGLPSWYHDGRPYQIGHCLAISPDCVAGAPACFVQPDDRKENGPRPSRGQTLISLWRESLFTPTLLAPRGPPSDRQESFCV